MIRPPLSRSRLSTGLDNRWVDHRDVLGLFVGEATQRRGTPVLLLLDASGRYPRGLRLYINGDVTLEPEPVDAGFLEEGMAAVYRLQSLVGLGIHEAEVDEAGDLVLEMGMSGRDAFTLRISAARREVETCAVPWEVTDG